MLKYWLQVCIRKVMRTVTSTEGILGFPVPKNKRRDGSKDTKLQIHASHVALPN